jgi:hypothetical protein
MPTMSRKAAPANADQQLPCSTLGWALSLPRLVPPPLPGVNRLRNSIRAVKAGGHDAQNRKIWHKVHGVSLSLDSRK